MINLLPTKEKTNLLSAYYIRVATLFVLTAFCVVLVGFLFLIPSYVITKAKESAAASQIATLYAKQDSTKEQLNTIIADINTKLSIFADPAHKFVFSTDVAAPVFSRKPQGVVITSIEFSIVNKVSTVSVTGVANNRQALLSFENNLKKESKFTGVNFPISDFAQGSDISFGTQFQLSNL